MSQLGLWKFLITVLFVFTVLVTVIKIGTEPKRLLEWLLDMILVGTKSKLELEKDENSFSNFLNESIIEPMNQ